jgi:hypothetical protein
MIVYRGPNNKNPLNAVNGIVYYLQELNSFSQCVARNYRQKLYIKSFASGCL